MTVSGSKAERARSAIAGWLLWRDARHSIEHDSGKDPLRAMLVDWWVAQGFPKVERLSEEQALAVLDWITEAEYEGRPL